MAKGCNCHSSISTVCLVSQLLATVSCGDCWLQVACWQHEIGFGVADLHCISLDKRHAVPVSAAASIVLRNSPLIVGITQKFWQRYVLSLCDLPVQR